MWEKKLNNPVCQDRYPDTQGILSGYTLQRIGLLLFVPYALEYQHEPVDDIIHRLIDIKIPETR
jgi:hypothetical protein